VQDILQSKGTQMAAKAKGRGAKKSKAKKRTARTPRKKTKKGLPIHPPPNGPDF
jgi:hypothetical protein